jgi:uncharacterized protein (DUF111 family)
LAPTTAAALVPPEVEEAQGAVPVPAEAVDAAARAVAVVVAAVEAARALPVGAAVAERRIRGADRSTDSSLRSVIGGEGLRLTPVRSR